MDKTVNRDIIDDWIDQNGPNGLARLSIESGVSPSTIGYARRGVAPKKDRTRLKLARAVGVAESILFPDSKKTKLTA
jgi:hypothetical protein